MTLLLEGYSYESYLFVPFALILQFLFIEIMPFLYSLDQNFLTKMGEKLPSASLTERLFEQQVSRIDISQDRISLPPSYEQNNLFNHHGHYSPNSILTPNEMNDYGKISDASSVAEFPYSQENKGAFSNNLGSITDT